MSGQQLADATATLGHPLPRSVIANLESGRRDTVSVAELLVLARALEVPPLQLVFPIGREAMNEVLPGTVIPTWLAAQWFTGEEAFPAALRDGGWGLSTKEMSAWKASVPLLFRELDKLYERWNRARGAVQSAQLAATEAETTEEKEVNIRNVELREELQRRAEDEVRRHRELIRGRGLDPGELRAEFAYIDEAP
ncbi:hypothetical protein SAMN05661080_04795 [Modestobacter sp. DSM 44400]|uniref:hypothetical protein n=1 Tax=Modestobacter sp. DSM 44400 TaxID=1550230 RepID=UPI00089A4401|nr:hypothetical protein SAMN05661080_04795 [Modestobacter sp. DSM 44400]